MKRLEPSPGLEVKFVQEVRTSAWPGEAASVVPRGATYRLQERIGEGWDLVRTSECGPENLRVLESELAKLVVKSE